MNLRPRKRDLALVALWLGIFALGIPTVESAPSHMVFIGASSFVLAVIIWAAGYALWLGVRKLLSLRRR